MPIEAPSQNGDMLSQADCLGHVMVIAPTEYIDHIQTVNTKPGEKSPAIRLNIADFNDPDNPVIYRGVLWFGVISNNLRRQIGSFIGATMGQGQASPGRNAPWQLNSVMEDAGWANFLNAWLDTTEAGEAFQVEAIQEVQRAAQAAAVAGNAAPVQAQAPTTPAPAAAPAASRPPAAAPAAPTASAPAPAPAAAPPAPSAPAPAAPAGDPMAQLAGLPAEELAKVMALLGQQGNAAH